MIWKMKNNLNRLVKEFININTNKIITQFIDSTFNNKDLLIISKKCKYFLNF